MNSLGLILVWINLGLMTSLITLDLLGYTIAPILLIVFAVVLLITFFIVLSRKNLILFFFRRILSSFFVIFVIASLSFCLLHVLPGGPFDEEKALSPQVKQNIETKYGLNQPVHDQYFQYLKQAASGHFGYSYKYEGREVADLIKEAFPISFKLGLYTLLLSFLIGVPLGLVAAAKKGLFIDKLSLFFAMSFISLPSFLLAPLLIYIFSFGWPFHFLTPHFYKFLVNYDLLLPAALWQTPKHYILPVITLSMRPAAMIARLTRASVLDIIDSDFVRTAKSKGLNNQSILYQHILSNSLVPILSYAGPLVAGILSGSFIVEIIFAIPGIAKYFVQGVFNRDYPLIMALTVVFSILLVFSNLIVDILYKIIDPRIEIS